MQFFKKILLVDDDGVANYLTIELLNELHAAGEIVVAEDGLEASELIKAAECPDIVFLDIRMPRMDGFEFLDNLEKESVCQNAKIVILSSSNRQEDKLKAFTYKRVIDYAEKPLTKEMIKKVARAYYRNKAD
jgi:CheY-like chemotaxis protein